MMAKRFRLPSWSKQTSTGNTVRFEIPFDVEAAPIDGRPAKQLDPLIVQSLARSR